MAERQNTVWFYSESFTFRSWQTSIRKKQGSLSPDEWQAGLFPSLG